MTSATSTGADRFWSRFVHACLPLAVWAAHFFGSYVFVAVGCKAGLDASSLLGVPVLSLVLLAATLLALALLALILAAPARSRGAHGDGDAVATVFRRGAAALSLVAVGWTALPMALLQSCA